MKKLSIFLTIVSMLLITPLVSAQGQKSPNATQNQTQNRLRFTDKLTEVLNRLADKMDMRFSNFERFLEKLQTRRTKLAELGLDVERIDARLRLANAELGNVRGAINQAKSTFTNLDYSQDKTVLRTQITAEIKKVQSAFTQLHNSAADVLEEIKVVGASQE